MIAMIAIPLSTVSTSAVITNSALAVSLIYSRLHEASPQSNTVPALVEILL